MIKKLTLIIIAFFFSFNFFQAQNETVGLMYSQDASDGYILFTPESNESVHLIDNCGNLINEWTFNETPGAVCYLLKNGNLLRAGLDSLQIRDWNNNVIWTYAATAKGIRQHHDIEPLPNGNILCLTNNFLSPNDVEDLGRDPSLIGNNFKIDGIIELEPVGNNDANVVWEWKFEDHLIQDFDQTKLNYGVVADHPELLDINAYNIGTNDWTHCNSVDYNENLDQILISARHMNEIYIIDHSTTTQEAQGHNEGNSGKGGDFLWRWGNPQVYDAGNSTDQKLFGQHDAKWVTNGFLDSGKISVFNNDTDGTNTFSGLHLIDAPFQNNEYEMTNNSFAPAAFEWTWTGTVLGANMWEGKKSGAMSLQNGNFIICESSKGKITEINKSGDLVWNYINPSAFGMLDQGDPIIGNTIFRAEKYHSNYVGFNGKDLTAGTILENQNNNSVICSINLDVAKMELKQISVYPNPTSENQINFTKELNNVSISICDMTGRTVFHQKEFTGNLIKCDLNSGSYLITITSKDRSISKIFIKN